MPGTPAETVTAYHRDGDAVLLTHYCGQGNQPRLRLVATADDTAQFERFDVTNASPDQGILTRLALQLDGDQLHRSETYAAGNDAETTDLAFTRLEP